MLSQFDKIKVSFNENSLKIIVTYLLTDIEAIVKFQRQLFVSNELEQYTYTTSYAFDPIAIVMRNFQLIATKHIEEDEIILGYIDGLEFKKLKQSVCDQITVEPLLTKVFEFPV